MEYNNKQLQIIETAEKLFATKGYNGTSVRDIAEDAGVNLAMISYYFGSKEKLMQAIFEERTRYVIVRIENLLKDDQLSPIEKIYALVDDYVARFCEKQQFFKLMLVEQMFEKNTVVIDSLNEMKKRNGEFIEKLIKDGQKKKAFKPNIDTVLLMNTMVGTITQSFISKDYYRFYHNLQKVPDEKYIAQLRTKISTHVKEVLKAILTYEA
jgi:AcrR family transcriptional regulator